MSQQITLFDLASQQDNQCWSPHAWKARLYLNYKGLEYKTVWLEYPEIKSTLEKHVTPNESSGKYTIPTIVLPDGTYVMESEKIVVEMEKRHPLPPLTLKTSYQSKLEAIIPEILKALSPELMPIAPERLLNEASIPFWHGNGLKRYGLPLEQVRDEQGGDRVYSVAATHVHQVTELLKQTPSGPFFEGEQVTFADFIWVGILRFLQRIGDDVFQKSFASESDVHLSLLEACRPWLQRDNY